MSRRLGRQRIAGSRRHDRPVLVVLEGFLGRTDDVGDVEERVALETEVNERRLHAREHFRDAAFVDVADHAARLFPLDEDFDDLIVLEDRHTRFVAASRR